MSKESRCFRVDETLDYVKDSLEHLSDNDEVFVSNCNDIKAARNMYYLGLTVPCCIHEVHDDNVDDAKEINDTTRTLDLSYEVVTK